MIFMIQRKRCTGRDNYGLSQIKQSEKNTWLWGILRIYRFLQSSLIRNSWRLARHNDHFQKTMQDGNLTGLPDRRQMQDSCLGTTLTSSITKHHLPPFPTLLFSSSDTYHHEERSLISNLSFKVPLPCFQVIS